MTSGSRTANGAGASGFVADASGARWSAVGPLTFANAARVLDAAGDLPLPSTGEVDCRDLGPVDSSAVAVLLAIKRRAANEGARLTFTGITGSLHTLADLYGVEDLLASASAPA